MVSAKRRAGGRAKKIVKRSRTAKQTRPRSTKKTETRKPPAQSSQGAREPISTEPRRRELFEVTLESIRGDTAIGDLLVFFPRTRDVLAKKGLRLEAEDAGDIYMTLDAFSAMNGLKTESLVQEIVEVARAPLQHQTLTQVAASPIS